MFETLLAPLLAIINKIVPNKELQTKLHAEITQSAIQGELNVALEQIKVNTVEAASSSMFVAGARPFILWVCGIGLAYNTLVLAVMKSILAFLLLFGTDPSLIAKVSHALPQVDMTLLGNVMTQMLGIGALSTLRTIEKIKGVSRDSLK